MTPKPDNPLLSAEDIDRLITISNASVLADEEQAPAAHEALLRIRKDLAERGLSTDLLARLDHHIDSLHNRYKN